MSATISISVRDAARAELARLRRKARDITPGLMVAGRGLANMLKAHYRRRDQTPNKLGGARTHYWREVGQSVQAPKPVGSDVVAVAITHPTITQKIKGGTIRARPGSALTIPVHPLAHGRRASVLNELLAARGAKRNGVATLPLFRPPGKNYLAAVGDAGELTVYYVLRKAVTQKADAEALPDEGAMREEVAARFGSWMRR